MALSLALLLLSAATADATSKLIFDAMVQMLGAPGEYNPDVWARAVACMEAQSPASFDVLESSDSGWEGFLDYGRAGGHDGDAWGQRNEQFREWNPTPVGDNDTIPGAGGILAGEPCNYCSNVAYLRTMLAMCEYRQWNVDPKLIQAISWTFKDLTMGSAFFHASGTKLGNKMDTEPMRQSAFLFHQVSVSGLPVSPVVTELSPAPRSKTALDFAEATSLMLLNTSVFDWQDELDAMDTPDYYLTYAAIVMNVLHIGLETERASQLAAILVPLFCSPSETEFLLESYEPALIAAQRSVGVNPTPVEKSILISRGVATLAKMLYAFFWQEEILPGPWIDDEDANARGAEMMPILNAWANELSGYNHTDPDVQNAVDVYPNDAICRSSQGHSKWHEQSGNALVDLLFLAHDAQLLINGRALPREERARDQRVLSCLSKQGCFDAPLAGSSEAAANRSLHECGFHLLQSPADSAVAPAVEFLGCIVPAVRSCLLCFD